MPRLAAALLPLVSVVLIVVGGVLAAPVHAEEAPRRVVLVIDRGAGARGGAASDAGNALRIWKALAVRDVDARVFAAGVGGTGKTMLTRVAPTRAGLAALGKDPMYAFRGPTDVRTALAWVLDAAARESDAGPIDLILLGPWSTPHKAKRGPYAGTIKRWNKNAPAGSRVFALGDGAGRHVLTDARGWAGDGRLVVGFRAPTVTPKPFSPLGHEGRPPAPLEAAVRVVGDILRLGPPPRAADGTPSQEAAGPVLGLHSDVHEDEIKGRVLAGLHTWTLRRRLLDGRTATLTFPGVSGDNIHWLGDPPGPLTFRWDGLASDARILGPAANPDNESAPTFSAVDASVGKPVSAAYRLQRTLAGRTPAWKVGVEATVGAQGTLPPGLSVHIGDEVRATPEVGETEVRVVFTATAGHPLKARGTITLAADGMPQTLRLPYDVRVPPGRAKLVAVVKEAALPRAAADEQTTLVVHAENGNVPPAILLAATCDGGQERWLHARLTTPGGDVTTWQLDQLLLFDVGAPRHLAFDLADDAPPDLPWPCHVTLTSQPTEGLEVTGKAEIVVRQRHPRITLVGAPPEYSLVGHAIVADTPLMLRLDADGGDGDWLLALRSVTPNVRLKGSAPIGWQAVARGGGVWHVVPAGRWSGPSPGIFDDLEVPLALNITWTEGDAPGDISVPVHLRARWGRRGFLLIGLAALALLLALTAMTWMRTPKVQGTLLYTVDGLQGVVGRLDLTPVGRRVRAITADEKGRLAITGGGTPLGKIRPTRVGGMFEYADATGARERRLLVEGLSLRVGRHLVRYVSGRAGEAAPLPADVPDLLGPEYDLASGRIDAMEEGDAP